MNINNQINIQTFENFKTEILKHFEPVNREINARKALSALKQMGAYSSITAYNAEFLNGYSKFRQLLMISKYLIIARD